MREPLLKAVVSDCCTLIGCFVPCEETLPLLLNHLEAAAEPGVAAAVLHIIAAITTGAGKLFTKKRKVYTVWRFNPAMRNG